LELRVDGRGLDALRDVRLHGDRGQPVAPPDPGLLEAVLEPRNLRERHGPAVADADLEIAEALQVAAVARLGAAAHVDEVRRVAHLRDDPTAERVVERARDLLRGEPEPARLILVDLDVHGLAELV